MLEPNREWGTVRQVKDRFGVTRTTIYNIANMIKEALLSNHQVLHAV